MFVHQGLHSPLFVFGSVAVDSQLPSNNGAMEGLVPLFSPLPLLLGLVLRLVLALLLAQGLLPAVLLGAVFFGWLVGLGLSSRAA